MARSKRFDKFQKAKRAWLNKDPTMTGSIAWELEGEDYAELNIRDCTRSISLEFGAYGDDIGAKDRQLRLKKLDRIIDMLTKFRDAMVAQDEWKAAKKQAEKKGY